MRQFILVLSISFLCTSCDSFITSQSGDSGQTLSSSEVLMQSSQMENWEVQENGIIENELEDVHFADTANGWAVGGQTILHTDDGGESWQQQENNTPALSAVHFVNVTEGWVVGEKTILHTDNGGDSWQQQGSNILDEYLEDSEENLYSVHFVNEQTGWAVASSISWEVSTIFHTDDGGQNWEVQFEYDPDPGPGDLGKGLRDIHFVNEQMGWAVGGAQEIIGPGGSPPAERAFLLTTNDGGQTWESNIASQPAGGWSLWDVYFTGAENGWIIGKVPTIEEGFSDQPISITNNGGESWSGQSIGEANAVHFVNPETGWTVGNRILHTTDGGQSWNQQIDVGVEQSLNSVYFVNEQNGWAVGRNGTIFHYSADEEPVPTEPAAEKIYGQSLQSPWINASWDAGVNFSSTEQVQSGSHSIRVEQQSWGALSLRRGSWNTSQNLSAGDHQQLQFAVYSPDQSLNLDLRLENDEGSEFPRVQAGTIEMNNAWTTLTVPLSKLNPDGKAYNRIDISESSGQGKTYFVDDIRLSKGDDSQNQEAQTIFEENLSNSWIDASWNANISFDHSSMPEARSGSSAIRVSQQPWGALSVHSGQWGSNRSISTGQYEKVSFAVYSKNRDLTFRLLLENAAGDDFPTIKYGTVELKNGWTTITVPFSKLNPDGRSFNRIDISEASGESKTYFIDDLKLIKSSGD